MTFDTATKQLVLNSKESATLKNAINDLTFAAQFPCPDAAKFAAESLPSLKKLDECVTHPTTRVRGETPAAPATPNTQPPIAGAAGLLPAAAK